MTRDEDLETAVDGEPTVEPTADADTPEADDAAGEDPPMDDLGAAGDTEEGDGTATPEDAQADGVDGVADAPDPAAALQDDYDALNDRHLRLAAEFNNYRRRSEQERLAAWSRAQADLLAKFLDVLDDLHRVADLDLTNATVEAIMEGIDLVEKKFVGVLADSDVEMIDPAGQPFDPEVMEAMMRVPAESEDQADTVAQVFQKGYAIKGTLVRPARVSVFTS